MIARSRCLIWRPDPLGPIDGSSRTAMVSLLDRASGLLDPASGICETGEQTADFDDYLAGTTTEPFVEQAENGRGRPI
jgi:hypothetical protein